MRIYRIKSNNKTFFNYALTVEDAILLHITQDFLTDYIPIPSSLTKDEQLGYSDHNFDLFIPPTPSIYTNKWLFKDPKTIFLEVWEVLKPIPSASLVSLSYHSDLPYVTGSMAKEKYELFKEPFERPDMTIDEVFSQISNNFKKINRSYRAPMGMKNVISSPIKDLQPGSLKLIELYEVRTDAILMVLYRHLIKSEGKKVGEFNMPLFRVLLSKAFTIPNIFKDMFVKIHTNRRYQQLPPNDPRNITGSIDLTTMFNDPFFKIIKELRHDEISNLCSIAGPYRKWCIDHSKQIWTYLLDRDYPTRKYSTRDWKNNLYITDPKKLYIMLNRPAKVFIIPKRFKKFRARFPDSDFTFLCMFDEHCPDDPESFAYTTGKYFKDYFEEHELVNGDIVNFEWMYLPLIMDNGYTQPLSDYQEDTDATIPRYITFPEYSLDHFKDTENDQDFIRLTEQSAREAMRTFNEYDKTFTITDLRGKVFIVHVVSRKGTMKKEKFATIVSGLIKSNFLLFEIRKQVNNGVMKYITVITQSD
jgi:hypothetical protein